MSRSTIITSVGLALVWFATVDNAHAATILGTGTGALLDNDLTDPDQNGTAGGANYDAIFTSTNEPGFGGGENSFNVFSNTLGGGNNKWCCDGPGGSGHQLTAQILPTGGNPEAPLGYVLTHFTISSSNDSPERDPRVWSIEGSNDGTNFTTIFSQNNPAASLWTDRDQVIRFDAGVDYALPAGFTHFRYNVTTTGGGNHALGEIEYFGFAPVPAPEPSTLVLAMFGLMGLSLRRRRRRA